MFAERAKEKDKEASDRAKENEAAMMKGKPTLSVSLREGGFGDGREGERS